jgi:hypothetical protein
VPIEVIFQDQNIQGEIVGEWSEVALFDAHHGRWCLLGIEKQFTDPDIQRLGW